MSLEKVISDNQKQYYKRKNQIPASSYDDFKTSPHIFSNNFDFEIPHDSLLNMPSMKIAGKENMAVLLGESYFPSIAPMLIQHVNKVLCIDKDERVLNHNKYMLECIKDSNTIDEFLDLLVHPDNPILKMKLTLQETAKMFTPQDLKIKQAPCYLDAKVLQELIASHQYMIPNLFFLKSESRFQECKAAIQQLQFYFLESDLLDTALMANLGSNLLDIGVNITLCNVTNLFDYDGNFALRNRQTQTSDWKTTGKLYDSLANLLARPEDTPILFSHMDPTKKLSVLTATIAFGLEKYKQATENFALLLNQKCRYEKLTKNEFPSTGWRYSFMFSKPYYSNQNESPSFIEAFKKILGPHFLSMKVSCQKVAQSNKGVCDLLVSAAPCDYSGLKDLLRLRGISFKERVLDNTKTLCIMDVNIPFHKDKILEIMKSTQYTDECKTARIV